VLRLLAIVCVLGFLIGACRGSIAPFGASPSPVTTGPSPSPVVASPTAPPVAPTPTVATTSIPLCQEVGEVTAPAEYYRDSPIYVSNEMPADEVRAWAATRPGYEDIWIDRDHLGWITVAFSHDAEARQAELEREFPGVGVVAVEVDWTMAELEALQRRVGDELMPDVASSSGIYITKGVVSIGVGVLRPERIAAVEERFAGERVCIEGIDPADAPPEGPQQPAGEGWRLLADEKHVGQPYRTWIASDEASYRRLWGDIGLAAEPPVDFETEVVVWFGAVFGSSCPNIRLDDVVVDGDRALVYPEIADLHAGQPCTADANAHAYVVAIERSRLPSGPFAIQLGPEAPPGGAPEERTLVEVDLSVPGAVAGPGDVHPDPSLPEPFVLEPGAIVEPGFPMPYRQSVHCGIEWLGPINDFDWRTDVPAGAIDYVPPDWEPAIEDELIQLSITLHTEPEPVILATANGHTVRYQPTAEQPPGCD
jgi:hypothetical protein